MDGPLSRKDGDVIAKDANDDEGSSLSNNRSIGVSGAQPPAPSASPSVDVERLCRQVNALSKEVESLRSQVDASNALLEKTRSSHDEALSKLESRIVQFVVRLFRSPETTLPPTTAMVHEPPRVMPAHAPPSHSSSSSSLSDAPDVPHSLSGMPDVPTATRMVKQQQQQQQQQPPPPPPSTTSSSPPIDGARIGNKRKAAKRNPSEPPGDGTPMGLLLAVIPDDGAAASNSSAHQTQRDEGANATRSTKRARPSPSTTAPPPTGPTPLHPPSTAATADAPTRPPNSSSASVATIIPAAMNQQADVKPASRAERSRPSYPRKPRLSNFTRGKSPHMRSGMVSHGGRGAPIANNKGNGESIIPST